MKDKLLPSLLELIQDETGSVKRISFDSFVDILDLFDAPTRDHVVIPFIKKFCREPPSDILPTFASLYGPMLVKISRTHIVLQV